MYALKLLIAITALGIICAALGYFMYWVDEKISNMKKII